MAERVVFEAVLRPEGSSTFVVVPEEVGERLGVRGRTSVKGTIDGRPFSNQVMPYGVGAQRQLLMVVNTAVRRTLGKVAGDTVTFELERDPRSRSAAVLVPPELAAALAADPEALAAWDALSPSHRREHAEAIAEAKRPETKERRVARTIERLRSGR
jgi:hypothetical protein